MKLSPLEIRKQTFRSTMRGFDKEDVRIFLDLVADEYEKVLQENGMLSEKIRYLNERLEEYHTLEKTLQNSILMAERVAAESREQARLDAESVIDDANVRAERILGDSRNRLQMLGDQINHLANQKEAFVSQFQALLDAQNQFLQNHQEDFETINELDAQTLDLLNETAPGNGRFDDHSNLTDDETSHEDSESNEKLVGEEASSDSEQQVPVADSSQVAESALEHEAQSKLELESDSPAHDGHRSPEKAAPAKSGPVAGQTNSGDKDDSKEMGFFKPIERREGFFELNAEEGARK